MRGSSSAHGWTGVPMTNSITQKVKPLSQVAKSVLSLDRIWNSGKHENVGFSLFWFHLQIWFNCLLMTMNLFCKPCMKRRHGCGRLNQINGNVCWGMRVHLDSIPSCLGFLTLVNEQVVLVGQHGPKLPQGLASHQRRCLVGFIAKDIERNCANGSVQQINPANCLSFVTISKFENWTILQIHIIRNLALLNQHAQWIHTHSILGGSRVNDDPSARFHVRSVDARVKTWADVMILKWLETLLALTFALWKQTLTFSTFRKSVRTLPPTMAIQTTDKTWAKRFALCSKWLSHARLALGGSAWRPRHWNALPSHRFWCEIPSGLTDTANCISRLCKRLVRLIG